MMNLVCGLLFTETGLPEGTLGLSCFIKAVSLLSGHYSNSNLCVLIFLSIYSSRTFKMQILPENKSNM